MAKFEAGNPGRTRGVPNKVTASVKEMILCALEDSGGVAYLQRQADENPQAFLQLVGKVLPLQITAEMTVSVELADRLKKARDRLMAASIPATILAVSDSEN